MSEPALLAAETQIKKWLPRAHVYRSYYGPDLSIEYQGAHAFFSQQEIASADFEQIVRARGKMMRELVAERAKQ